MDQSLSHQLIGNFPINWRMVRPFKDPSEDFARLIFEDAAAKYLEGRLLELTESSQQKERQALDAIRELAESQASDATIMALGKLCAGAHCEGGGEFAWGNRGFVGLDGGIGRVMRQQVMSCPSGPPLADNIALAPVESNNRGLRHKSRRKPDGR